MLGQPQIQITIDRDAIARYGLAVADVQSVVATAIGGQTATQVLEGERTFDLVVKLAPKSVADVESVRQIPIFGSSGERLTLGTVAAVEVRAGLARVEREENQRRTAIKLSVRDRDLGSLVAEAQQKVSQAIHLPTGYRLEWTGSFENEQRAEKRLAVVVPITIAAIFFLLFVAFDSVRFAILILLTVPFSAAGGLMALPVAGLNMSVSALVGFVALFGVSIQNSVILVTRIRELRREGKQVRVHQGGRNFPRAANGHDRAHGSAGSAAHGAFQRCRSRNGPPVRRGHHRRFDQRHRSYSVHSAAALPRL